MKQLCGIVLAFVLAGLLALHTTCGNSQTPPDDANKDTQIDRTTPLDPAPQEVALQIVSVTSPVRAGSYATLVAETEAGADCTITVYYKSGPSEAAGLAPKSADGDGRVSWTWKVGTRTTPGSWRIVVTATVDGVTAIESAYFTVT